MGLVTGDPTALIDGKKGDKRGWKVGSADSYCHCDRIALCQTGSQYFDVHGIEVHVHFHKPENQEHHIEKQKQPLQN